MFLKDHLNKFNYFVIAIDAGSLSRGASNAYISQPQMSKVIASLEQALGVQLVNRSKSGIVPTPKGKDLYEFAKDIISKTNELELRLRSKAREFTGEITLGLNDVVARYFISDFFNYIRESNPTLRVNLSISHNTEIFREENVDLSIVVGEYNEEEYNSEVVYKDSLALYMSPRLQSSDKTKLIYFSGESKYHPTELMTKLNIQERFTCDNIEMVRTLAEQAHGVGILPRTVAREDILKGRLVEYKVALSEVERLPDQKVSFVYSKNINDKAELIEYIKDELKRYAIAWAKR